jgi:hypothetical protein
MLTKFICSQLELGEKLSRNRNSFADRHRDEKIGDEIRKVLGGVAEFVVFRKCDETRYTQGNELGWKRKLQVCPDLREDNERGRRILLRVFAEHGPNECIIGTVTGDHHMARNT